MIATVVEVDIDLKGLVVSVELGMVVVELAVMELVFVVFVVFGDVVVVVVEARGEAREVVVVRMMQREVR
jgi:hypothetical protein